MYVIALYVTINCGIIQFESLLVLPDSTPFMVLSALDQPLGPSMSVQFLANSF